MQDFLETPEKIPANILDVLNSFNCEQMSYQDCAKLKQSLNSLGWDIDYYLDAIPFNLHPITTPRN